MLRTGYEEREGRGVGAACLSVLGAPGAALLPPRASVPFPQAVLLPGGPWDL